MTEYHSPPSKEIIATVITHRGKLALFKRSEKVTGDQGYWHCITGFVDPGRTPDVQALQEVNEEAGIPMSDLTLKSKSLLEESDRSGNTWTIHAFHFESRTDTISLNWENDDAAWTHLGSISQFQTVYWLSKVFDALGDMVAALECPQSDALVGWS